MDIISHGLIGCLIGQFDKSASPKKVLGVGFAAMLPDFFQIPYYLVLGYLNNRPYWIPKNSDWIGFRGKLPMLDLVWDVPHSLFFLFLVVLPLVYYFRLGIVIFLGYLSHIIVDLPTHTGEWNVRYFFPFQYTINGVTDAWSWGLTSLVISWVVLAILNFGIYSMFQFLKF